MSEASLPRWYVPRARRLIAAVVEATIDARGHGALRPLLGSPEGVASLFAVAGGSGRLHEALVVVRDALVLPRLDVTIDGDDVVQVGADRFVLGGQGGRVLAFPARAGAPLGSPDASGVIRALEPKSDIALVDIRRLTAALHAARGVLPEALADLGAKGGLGSRALCALSLVAEVVCDGPPARDPERLRFALGSLDGTPYPVAVRAFDLTLTTLESLLHGKQASTAARVDALWALHRTTERVAERVTPGASERMRQREHKRAADLLAFGRAGPIGHDLALPRVPRRRTPTTRRVAAVYSPPPPPDFEPPLLDRQGNLFAP